MNNGSMTSNGHHDFSANGTNTRTIGMPEILQILKRQKWLLIGITIIMVLLALLYNLFSTPVYRAATMIKKEKPLKDYGSDDVSKIIQMGSPDEIETEIEILKTRAVLDKVVDELMLFFHVGKIDLPNTPVQEYNMDLADFKELYTNFYENPAWWPRFSEFAFMPGYEGGSYFIDISSDTLRLFNAEELRVLNVITNSKNARFQAEGVGFTVDCSKIISGSQIYFSLKDPDVAILDLKNNIEVDALRKTSIFRVSAESHSPYMAMLLANTLADKFRETRLEHKRQTIRYSYDFVDKQLEEINANLKAAEAELSGFRSKNQIVAIDETSRGTIEFLSNLESEKVKTDLQLAEYRNRHKALSDAVGETGYFDQTYLTPTQSDQRDSPFSVLLRQLSEAELERLELLQKRTDNHPDVLAIDQRIEQIKTRLAGFNQNTITSYQVFITSLEQKQRDLRRLIRKYESKIKALPAFETRLLSLNRKKGVYEKMFVQLLDKREEMRMAELSKLQDIVIVDPADVPYRPVRPRQRFNLFFGLVFGLMCGLVTIFWRELRSDTIRSINEIEDVYGLPVMSILPVYPKQYIREIDNEFTLENHLELLTDAEFGYKEAYRVLRTRLSHTLKDNKIFMVSSCEENTGKTTVLTNYAVALALAEKKVLVIDCDLRKPKVGEFFGLPYRSPGLIGFLTRETPRPTIYTPFEKINGRKIKLDVIPSGGTVDNSSELLDSEEFRMFLNDIATYYDYVLIDTPPVTRTVDALVVGGFIKEMVFIIRPNLTHKDSLAGALQDLRQFDVNVLGTVVNACDEKLMKEQYRHGYSYGYGYQYQDQPDTGRIL
ncbi:MAG: GumC family protein [Calditrichia bacterium]